MIKFLIFDYWNGQGCKPPTLPHHRKQVIKAFVPSFQCSTKQKSKIVLASLRSNLLLRSVFRVFRKLHTLNPTLCFASHFQSSTHNTLSIFYRWTSQATPTVKNPYVFIIWLACVSQCPRVATCWRTPAPRVIAQLATARNSKGQGIPTHNPRGAAPSTPMNFWAKNSQAISWAWHNSLKNSDANTC